MNWLITGGCGFIGRNLIKELVNQHSDINIRVVDNFSVGRPSDLKYATNNFEHIPNIEALNWNHQLQVIEGDIMDQDLAIRLAEGANVVIHLAANTGVGPSVENPRMDCTTNVLGTFNYLEACRIHKVQRFVFASSGAPIGECIPPIHEELACHPVSPYGASKLAGEAYCSAYFQTFKVDTVALRFGNIYGPGSTHKSSVVAKFIRQAMNGETLEIYGDGTQTRDFIFTRDLINAIYLGATKEGIGGEIFQIATNKETTVLEVTEALLKAMNDCGIGGIEIKHGPKRLGDVMRNFSDTSKAERVLGWTCKNELNDGLKETINWFVQALKVS